jgi:hypothetical protein
MRQHVLIFSIDLPSNSLLELLTAESANRQNMVASFRCLDQGRAGVFPLSERYECLPGLPREEGKSC